jgi:hypothetical protein
LDDNGFRSSYGIVLAMFGVTVGGCWYFRWMLQGLNKQLEESELADVGREGSTDNDILEHPDESLRMRKGFRYLV